MLSSNVSTISTAPVVHDGAQPSTSQDALTLQSLDLFTASRYATFRAVTEAAQHPSEPEQRTAWGQDAGPGAVLAV